MSWHYPPVRYCVAGDTPPEASAYTSGLRLFASEHNFFNLLANGLLDQSMRLPEIKVSPENASTPIDWRAQCAGFADFKVTTRYVFIGPLDQNGDPLHVIEVVAQPTRRTVYLANEVLSCTANGDCDLCPPGSSSCPSPTSAVAQRADLAICSMLADTWGRVCERGVCDTTPFINFLDDRTLNWRDTVRAVLVALANLQGSPQLIPAINRTANFIDTCRETLEARGFVIPQTYAPADNDS